MDTQAKSVKAHLFICCRSKQDKECCGSKNAVELVSKLKSWSKNSGNKEQIKVSQSSCLGHCENGITACLYPQNKWFTGISLQDEELLKEQLLKACQP